MLKTKYKYVRFERRMNPTIDAYNCCLNENGIYIGVVVHYYWEDKKSYFCSATTDEELTSDILTDIITFIKKMDKKKEKRILKCPKCGKDTKISSADMIKVHECKYCDNIWGEIIKEKLK